MEHVFLDCDFFSPVIEVKLEKTPSQDPQQQEGGCAC